MLMQFKQGLKTLSSAVIAYAMQGISWCKVSFMVGSYAMFFSLTSCVYPLAGLWMNSMHMMLFFLSMGVVKIILIHGFAGYTAFSGIQLISMLALALHIPAICSAWALSKRSFMSHVALPLACMALFVAHPVGYAAAPYAMFWLIPVAIYLSGSQAFFARAFASTLVAHGVGSVVWLGAKPAMTAEMWLGLMPVVCVERLVFAAGTTLLYHAVVILQKFVKDHMRRTSYRADSI